MKITYISLEGHTFVIKDELKTKFNAIWNTHDSVWMVSTENQEEAQNFINNFWEQERLKEQALNDKRLAEETRSADLLAQLEEAAKSAEKIKFDYQKYVENNASHKVLATIEGVKIDITSLCEAKISSISRRKDDVDMIIPAVGDRVVVTYNWQGSKEKTVFEKE